MADPTRPEQQKIDPTQPGSKFFDPVPSLIGCLWKYITIKVLLCCIRQPGVKGGARVWPLTLRFPTWWHENLATAPPFITAYWKRLNRKLHDYLFLNLEKGLVSNKKYISKAVLNCEWMGVFEKGAAWLSFILSVLGQLLVHFKPNFNFQTSILFSHAGKVIVITKEAQEIKSMALLRYNHRREKVKIQGKKTPFHFELLRLTSASTCPLTTSNYFQIMRPFFYSHRNRIRQNIIFLFKIIFTVFGSPYELLLFVKQTYRHSCKSRFFQHFKKTKRTFLNKNCNEKMSAIST